MPKKRPDYSVLVKRNEDIFRKIFESEFWRCEYTKRKYILDIKDRYVPERFNFLKPYCSEVINHALRYVMYHADIALGICNDNSAPRNEMYDYLEQVLVAYHNFKYMNNPKFRIQNIGELGFDFWDLSDCLSDREIRSIDILHADARKYGFFPMDMIHVYPPEEIESLIKDDVKEHGEMPYFQSPFLIDSMQDPDFYYKDRQGNRYFVDEESVDAVYVYIDCLDEKETVEKIYKRIIGLINMALKQRGKHVAGDRENSDIQICFYNKSIIHDKKKLKDILENNLSAYRNWYSPENFMMSDDTIKCSKYLIVPEYENVPFHKRAAGLWIWDQVHFYNLKVSDAVEKTRSIKAFKWHRNVEMITIERAYRLASRSIEQMKVLRFSDL